MCRAAWVNIRIFYRKKLILTARNSSLFLENQGYALRRSLIKGTGVFKNSFSKGPKGNQNCLGINLIDDFFDDVIRKIHAVLSQCCYYHLLYLEGKKRLNYTKLNKNIYWSKIKELDSLNKEDKT